MDELPLAKNALVFMAVALSGHWKVPLGYFLLNSLGSFERASLMTQCLHLLSKTGAKCCSITFDGAPVNISMCKHLGCNFDIDNMKSWFLGWNNKKV